MPAVSPIALLVEKIPTMRKVRSSILNVSPTPRPYCLAARQPSIISSVAVPVNERPETTCTPYDDSSRGRSPTSMKNGCCALTFPVCTNTPIALSTPFIAPIALISCSVIVLYNTSEAPFCDTLKSAFPSCNTDTAVSCREFVSTPNASTAMTPMATATAVTSERSRLRHTLCARSPMNVTTSDPRAHPDAGSDEPHRS